MMTNLSTIYLAIFTFGLYPRLVKAYDVRGGLSLFEPSSSLLELWEPSDTISAMMRRQEDAMDQLFSSLRGSFTYPFAQTARDRESPPSPPYNIINSKDAFRMEVDLVSAGVQPSDIDIQFDEQNRQLTVSGHAESKNDETGYLFSSSFSKSFTLDPFVQVDQMTATIDDDGRLKVSAPKDVYKSEHAVRSIPVTNTKTTAFLDGGEEKPLKVATTTTATSAGSSDQKAAEADPFHVKERVEKARLQRQQKDIDDEVGLPKNPNAEDPVAKVGYKTSELRRRR